MNTRISVYIIKTGHNVCLGTFDTAKLTRFSHYAGTQLSRGGSTGKVLPIGSVTIPGTQAEGGGGALQGVGPLTAEVVGIEVFPEFVYLHRATMILRSDSVRNDVIDYVRAAPLRFDEFAMVLQVCNFDSSLATIVKNTTMEFKLHGMFEEWKRIEQAFILKVQGEKKAGEAKKGGKGKGF